MFACSGIQGSRGPATSLFFEKVPTPVPKKDEVLVRVKAFGLNRMDISQREGRYPVPPQAPPILGVEFSGVVHQVRDIGVQDDENCWEVGDEVFGLVYGGMHNTTATVSSMRLDAHHHSQNRSLCGVRRRLTPHVDF
jgi:NADPH2:quinone reductase